MKTLLLIVLLFVGGIASSQTTYISKEHDSLISTMLEKIKTEYKDNGISNSKFHLLDSIIVESLPYPKVGVWSRSGYSHKIELHEWLTRSNTLSLEYTFKHELGHMHGLKHSKDSKDMMYAGHSLPSTQEEWECMNKKYYTDLKKLLTENKSKT